MLLRVVKILGISMRILVKPISNPVIVTKLHACFEESIGGEVEGYIKCNLFFLRSLVSEEKVNIRGFSRRIRIFSVEKTW